MRIVLGVVFVLSVLAAAPIATAQSQLEGVWKIVESTRLGPNPPQLPNLQAGFYIFTKKHFSFTAVGPRPDLPQENATDAQKVAAWGAFGAQAGTYEIKGTTLTTHPTVAKGPANMAPGTSFTYELKIEGDTLWLTWKERNNTAWKNPIRTKTIRVE